VAQVMTVTIFGEGTNFIVIASGVLLAHCDKIAAFVFSFFSQYREHAFGGS
jgi:hypothetical protein